MNSESGRNHPTSFLLSSTMKCRTNQHGAKPTQEFRKRVVCEQVLCGIENVEFPRTMSGAFFAKNENVQRGRLHKLADALRYVVDEKDNRWDMVWL